MMCLLFTSMLSKEVIFISSQDSYQRLKRASRALATLQMSLDTKLLLMGNSLLPAANHFGIHRLADETLLRIIQCCLDQAAEGQYEFRTFLMRRVRMLALVNRKFRDLVYGYPPCWTMVDSSSRKAVGRQLHMSKDAGLQVFVDSSSLDLGPFIPRCTSLRVPWLYFHRLPEAVSIPHLETLELGGEGNPEERMRFSTAMFLSERKGGWDSPSLHRELLSTWFTPRLRTLSISGPLLSADEGLYKRLVALDFHSVRIKEASDLQALVGDLRRATSLQRLNLHLRLNVRWLEDESVPEMQAISLPKLTDLSLSFTLLRCWPEHNETSNLGAQWVSGVQMATALTRSLCIPRVLSLSISIENRLGLDDDFKEWRLVGFAAHYFSIDALFPPTFSAEELQNLSFRLRISSETYDDDEGRRLLLGCLRRFPTIQSFTTTFGMRHMWNNTEHGCMELARLRCLRIENCYEWSINDFNRTLEAIAGQEVFKLESITVTRDDGKEPAMSDPSFWTKKLSGRIIGGRRIFFS